MMMEATELGIGTTWIMYFVPEAIKIEFDLSDNIEPVAILIMGNETVTINLEKFIQK